MTQINLNPNLIFLNQKITNKEELFAFVAKQAKSFKLTNNPQAVIEALEKREQAYATGMMHGFVMPHGIIEDLQSSEIIIVKFNSNINWKMLDDSRAQYAFVLLIKAQDYFSGKHIENLQAISCALIKQEIIKKIHKAKNVNQILKIFKTQKGEK